MEDEKEINLLAENTNTKIPTATFVIVGGGIAGVSCVETLAFLCPNETIILLTETSLIKAVKNLVPLAKHIYKFDVEETDTSKAGGIMENNTIQIIVDELKSIESKTNSISTVNGRIISYKYLCLCTGARPKLIEPNNKRIIGIRDTDSVLDFQKRIKESRRLALVGNGGIATEIAYEVKNIEIEWIIKDKFISSTFVDAGAAYFFQESHRAKKTDVKSNIVKRMQYSEIENINSAVDKRGAALGPDWHRKIDIAGMNENIGETLRIHYETQVKLIETINSGSFPICVILTNGEKIECDFVVSATGVNPEINYSCDQELLHGPDGGISVNELMKTNIDGIYAAGDVCFAAWNHADNWFQMRLWTQARQMGCMAGHSMAAAFDGRTIYQDFCFELFGHVTQFFGYQVVLLGRYNGQGLGTDYEILLRTTPGVEYIKFVLQNGKLRGAILIGETGLEETCENLILNQIDLTPFGDDILNPDIDIEDFFD